MPSPRAGETPAAQNRPTRVLAVHSGALGDVIIFGRLLEMLGGRITLVAGREKGLMLAGMGAVDSAIDFDSLPMHEIFSGKPADQCRLPEMLGRHDVLLSCFASGENKAGKRLRDFCGARDAIFLPTRPPADFAGHLLGYWCSQLKWRCPEYFCAWPVAVKWKKQARQLLNSAGAAKTRRYIAIHPGSGGLEKCWPTESFKHLAQRIESSSRKRPMRTVWIFGQVEMERWARGDIRSIAEKFTSIICPNLEDLCGLLSLARGYVGNDSGVSHLAAAVGCPTVAIFGPTNPAHFRPLGPKVKIVGGSAKIEKIDQAMVFSAVSQMVRGNRAG